MAKELKAFPKSQRGYTTYPWGKWANGKIWQIERGIDYTTSDHIIRQLIYKQAKAFNKKAKVVVVKESVVVFQFREKEDDE